MRFLRLFPAVILSCGVMFAIKSVGLVHDARAQDAMTGQLPVPQPQTETQVALASDPTADDSEETSTAEVDVLTSLSKRRAALDAREQQLNMQENLIKAAEARVDTKIASLKQMQATMQQLLGQRDTADQTQLNSLVKTYSSMKPADAARIFNNLDETVELNVAAGMKSDVLGAILGKMEPGAAQKLTVRLANRLKLPDPKAAAIADPNAQAASAAAATMSPATPQQLASLNPAAPVSTAPTTPAAPTPAAPQPAPTTPAQQQPIPAPQAATTPPMQTPAKAAATTPKPAAPAAAKPATATKPKSG
jgi:flagellar motility protein MotE (MotC chaperone)